MKERKERQREEAVTVLCRRFPILASSDHVLAHVSLYFPSSFCAHCFVFSLSPLNYFVPRKRTGQNALCL